MLRTTSQAQAEAQFPSAVASLSRALSLDFGEDNFLDDGEGSTAAADCGYADVSAQAGRHSSLG